MNKIKQFLKDLWFGLASIGEGFASIGEGMVSLFTYDLGPNHYSKSEYTRYKHLTESERKLLREAKKK